VTTAWTLLRLPHPDLRVSASTILLAASKYTAINFVRQHV
jgi:hypothetical protein